MDILTRHLCALMAAGLMYAGDQPQWGQRHTRNMVSTETNLPASFKLDTGRNVKWTADLGTSTYSTPVVARGKVLIGTNNGNPRDARRTGDRGVLMCFREEDGRFLWQLVLPKRDEDPYLDWPHIGIVSPATVEGDRVYLISNRAQVLCLDLNGLEDGNQGFQDEARLAARKNEAPVEPGGTDADVIWVFDMPAEVGAHNHDAACGSVLLHERFLYVNTGNGVDNTHRRITAPDAPSLLVLDKETGRLLARDQERMGPRVIHSQWSSPSIGEVNGRLLVFYGGGDGVCYAFEALRELPPGAAPVSLKLVWRFDCDPAAPKENIHKWQDNFREGPSNITGMPVFDRGRVLVTSGGDLWHGKPETYLKCIDATGTGDVTRTAQSWSARLSRYCLSTPAIVDGLAYISDCGGLVHCIDAQTGKEAWSHKANGEIWGSPLVADRKVYAGAESGQLCVLAAGREKRLLSVTEFDSAISASPVAANRVLYVATMNRLYALEQQ